MRWAARAACLVTVAAMCVLLGAVAGRAEGDPAQNKAIKEWEYYHRLGTPGDRVTAMHRLRTSADAKTLELLIERYDRCDEPREVERYLIAQFASAYWTGKGYGERLAQWASRRKSDEDLWLLWRMCRFEKSEQFTAFMVKEAANGSTPWPRRAVLVSALAERGHAEAYRIARQVFEDGLPKGGTDRAVAYEAVLDVLQAFKGKLGSEDAAVRDPYVELLKAVVEAFPESKSPTRSSLVASRLLQRVMAPALPSLSKDYWRRRFVEVVYGTGEGERTAIRLPPAAKFAGLTSNGHRIVYVIDLSDSMLLKLNEAEIAAAKALFVEDGKEKKPAEGDEPDGEDDEIPVFSTRLELAKALLARSLRGLGQDQEFAVIGFGFEAEVIGGNARFVKATEYNILPVLAALDQIKPRSTPEGWGAAQGSRPEGQLWGYTNLHAGLLLAAQLHSTKPVESKEHIDDRVFDKGCDTVFVFSDGAPTWSHHTVTRKSEPGERYLDLESGQELGPAGEKITIIGPYRQRSLAIADATRMAMLRRFEIHTFGMADTDPKTLTDLAERTGGKARMLVEVKGEGKQDSSHDSKASEAPGK